MRMAWVLKIRRSGDEDDVFLFDDLVKIRSVIFEYFDLDMDELPSLHRSLDGLQDYLMQDDIGYFDVWREPIR